MLTLLLLIADDDMHLEKIPRYSRLPRTDSHASQQTGSHRSEPPRVSRRPFGLGQAAKD